MAKFTVIGYYEDTDQRFASVYEAESCLAAELQALDENSQMCLVICGTVNGEVTFADHDSMYTRSEP